MLHRLLAAVALGTVGLPASHAQPLFYTETAAVPPGDAVQNRSFGRTAASVGDLDGDGHPEFAVAAPGTRTVRVYDGRDGTLLYAAAPPAPPGRSGLAVAAVGDVTGDGAGDLAVSVTVSGSPGRVHVLSGTDGSVVWTTQAPAEDATGFGDVLAAVGDLDGDGRSEVAVGAPGADAAGALDAGRAFVLSGATGAVLHTLRSPTPEARGAFGSALAGAGGQVLVGAPGELLVNGTPGAGRVHVFEGRDMARTISAPASDDLGGFGAALDLVGDLDGDGTAEVAAGAPEERVGDVRAGRMYVLNPETGTVLYALASHVPYSSAHFGASATALADLDGDGVPEVAVGAPGVGRVHVFSGRAGRPLKLVGSPSAEFDGVGRDGFGAALVDLTHPDGSGRPRLLVGAPEAEVEFQSRSGRAYTVTFSRGNEGGAGPVVLTSPLTQPNGSFGAAIAVLDDLSGDGRPEVLVGGGATTSRTGEQRVYVIDGADASVVYTLRSPSGAGNFGAAATRTCDLDNDGVSDFIVGSVDPNLFERGGAHVFSGADGTPLYALTSPSAAEGGAFGFSLAAAPDVDGDGLCDIAVGALDEGAGEEGRVHLFSGRDGALVRTLDSPSGDRGGEFGRAVVAVGDLDGDGVGEVAVGARRDEGGRVYVFGGRDGALLLTLRPPGSPSPFHFFGTALASPGDLDGDGVPDLVVGASNSPPSAYAFSGASGSLLYEPQDPGSDGPDRRYGWALAPAGDLDGDGTGDFAVGAPYVGVRGAGGVVVHSGVDGALLASLEAPFGEGEWFGSSLAFGGGTAVVGAPSATESGVPGAGRAYVFPTGSFGTGVAAGPGGARFDGVGIHPNPTTGRTVLSVALTSPGAVTVRAYDVLGRAVRPTREQVLASGAHEVPLDLRGLAAGAYIVVVGVEGQRAARLVTVR